MRYLEKELNLIVAIRDRRERSRLAFPMRKTCLKIHRNRVYSLLNEPAISVFIRWKKFAVKVDEIVDIVILVTTNRCTRLSIYAKNFSYWPFLVKFSFSLEPDVIIIFLASWVSDATVRVFCTCTTNKTLLAPRRAIRSSEFTGRSESCPVLLSH